MKSFALVPIEPIRYQEQKLQVEKLEVQKEEKELTELEKKRIELRNNEAKALDFIFPSIENGTEAISRENFFSRTEKEQLLGLWRSTIARNRTIQFIIKSLSKNPNEIEKNNAVMQVLSRALFVPFYAVSAVAENSLISGGSAVGARVLGDVVDGGEKEKNHDNQIERTDLIVLFMLVDEVAERLRTAYYAYKEAKIEKGLLNFELKPARLDASEAIEIADKSSVFFTRMVERDLERQLRKAELRYITNRRTLLELAGNKAVEDVDLLVDLEVEEVLAGIVGGV